MNDILKSFKDFLESKEKIERLLLDKGIPHWLVILLYIFLSILGLYFFAGGVLKIWKEHITPLYYDPEKEKRKMLRKRFAKYINKRTQYLNEDEQLEDYRFTDLEAEVEVEGKRKHLISKIPFISFKRAKICHEASLSKVLETSCERLILVLGDSGSGKTVTLKHIAKKLSEKSIKDKNLKSVIPLYINLNRLSHSPEEKIDRNLIESFVKKELNLINDPAIDDFLENEFQVGMEENAWLFLFDSFDEIPAVLSSGELDQVISKYTVAIKDFLISSNECRGIVASREFHGPNNLHWPRFRILPLDNRRWELIKKMKMNPKIKKRIIGDIKNASKTIQNMTRNPMFLRILCESLQENSLFPKDTHAVFENYLEKRISHDADKLMSSFGLTPSDTRTNAEKIAFCMLIDPDLGLSASHNHIAISMEEQGFLVVGGIEKYFSALESIHLARSIDIDQSKSFTFSHRRFQEYFATCFVLSDLNRISPRLLLTDGRWRETVVVIFQTQPLEKLTYLLEETRKILDEKISGLSGIIENPIEYINKELIDGNLSEIKPFNWPSGLYPLLMTLQDGFISRIDELPDDISIKLGQFLLTASIQGTRADRKSSLEAAGITPQPIFLYLLRCAFKSESQWLKEVAYRRISLKIIPDDIATEIRKSLLHLYFKKRLHKDFDATYAYLSRLDNSSIYVKSINLLKYLKILDVSLHIATISFLSFKSLPSSLFALIPLCIISLLLAEDFYSFVGGFKVLYKGDSSLNIFKVALAAYIRIIPIIFILPFSNIFWPLVVILAPLIIFWPLLIILSIKSGKSIGLIRCLGLPVSYILSIKNILKIFQLLSIPFKTSWSLVIFPICFLMYVTISWISQNPNLITVGISLFLCVLIIRKSFSDCCLWVKDLIRWKKWIKKKQLFITSEELLKLIDLYHHPEFCKKTITEIRKNGKIEEDIEGLLTEMVCTFENATLFRKRKIKEIKEEEKDILKTPVHLWRFLKKSYNSRKLSQVKRSKEVYLYNGSSHFFESWLERFTSRSKMRFTNLGDEFIDELYLLIEQFHSEEISSFKSEFSEMKNIDKD